jgi:hypothetical protein
MSVTCALWLILQLLFPFPRKKLNMSTGQAPSLLLDLAATVTSVRWRGGPAPVDGTPPALAEPPNAQLVVRDVSSIRKLVAAEEFSTPRNLTVTVVPVYPARLTERAT